MKKVKTENFWLFQIKAWSRNLLYNTKLYFYNPQTRLSGLEGLHQALSGKPILFVIEQ
jgi:hypothetical protein